MIHLQLAQRVDEALHEVLGITIDIAHELLVLGSDLLGFAPIPGLGGAARTLLHIWDAALKVTAGDEVSSELRGPLDRLTKSFDAVRNFVDKQSLKTAFTKYFQREKIERAVRKHQNSLNDAVILFNLTIQIRTLTKVIKAGNLNDETYNKLRTLFEPHLPSSSPLKIPQQANDTSPLSGANAEHTQPASTPARDIKYDAVHKATDLRQVMNDALQMDSDPDMVRVLQAGLAQTPEAMKMLKIAIQVEYRTVATQSDPGNLSEDSSYHNAVKEKSISHDAMTGGAEVASLGHNASGPSGANEQAQSMQIAQLYRMLLQHEFHPSLTLPLWTPSPIPIGAVGYYTDSEGGSFVTLFDSFDPARSSRGRAKDVTPLGHDSVSQRWDRRSYSSSLGVTNGAAMLFTQTTHHRYIEDLKVPRQWFKENAEQVLAIYGAEYSISREDLCLGTLEAQEHALLVSQKHPTGQVHFNVFSAAKAEEPWGKFSFSTDRTLPSVGGPNWDDSGRTTEPLRTFKVSSCRYGGPWDTVLLSCLRFTSGDTEPTLF
ncbi:uncharacterized protein TRAVEDRAFT_20381 [Trametes versicolor FP-101664 SS1]|uniref:uncharacterized protein n=1 Tax=Trametes versicolor (strain FP-101664) TaxID=717944 RepID=UPI00046222F8|nr:uncharacterized protein TRAVEDRAFT_20381 [Trametes versicolor FP-101664 SS1]EIW58351.1 hypothetical protein TRAVEDRAFT_20381 [Trametes versicolor FP-101664 SS1]